MNFFKLVRYDIKQGFLYNKVKFMILAIIIILFCISFKVDAIKYTGMNKFTFGDYVLYVVEGMRHIPIEEIQNYMMPINWLGIQVLIGYIVGYYTMDDLHTYGQQILIRTNSRNKWFASKCIWNVCMVILVYVVIYSIILIFTIIAGDSLGITITRECIENYVFKTKSVNVSNIELVIMLFLMPVFVSITVSLLQMVISIIISPIISFIIGQIIMLGSTLFSNKLLIGNYSMFAKNEINGMTDINIYEGMIICTTIIVVTLWVGIKYFNSCNILSKE